MAIEVKRKMLQREYAWTAVPGDDAQARKIDATLLNRHEGYEVVPMIQKVVDHFGYENEGDVLKVESLIGDELPGNVRGRQRVFDWLVERLERERATEAPPPKAKKKAATRRPASKRTRAAAGAAKEPKAAKTLKVKRNMLRHEYVWEAAKGDDPTSTVIDARFLNRHEGYEVIPMIQKVVDHFGYESEADVRKVEDLIREALPGNVRGRQNAFDWLVERVEAEKAAEAAAREAAEKEEAARKAAAEEAAAREAAEREEAARQAAAEEAARKAAAKRAAALEAKWQVPETWRFSQDEIKKKVAVCAAFEEVARHLVGVHETTGELPDVFTLDGEELASGSVDPSVQFRIARYDCDQPPVGTYHGRFDFIPASAEDQVSFRLDVEHTGRDVSGTSAPST